MALLRPESGAAAAPAPGKTWHLVDCAARAAAHPGRFDVPPPSCTSVIRPGDFVKILFIYGAAASQDAAGTPPTRGERIWVQVSSIDGVKITGRLVDDPSQLTVGIRHGDPVEFEVRHVADWSRRERF